MPTKFEKPKVSYEWPLFHSTEKRFWAKVAKVEKNCCWLWLACLRTGGYGQMRNGAYMAYAHRLSWVMVHGRRVPKGLFVLHKCDTPACVNPDHLYVGTHKDNMRDKKKRGRSSYPRPDELGEKHPMAKLSDAQVLEIRSGATGRRGEGIEISRKYGISKAQTSRILNGLSR